MKSYTMTRLEFLRRKNRWTQQRLAELLGIQRYQASQLERGILKEVPPRWHDNLHRVFPEYSFEELMEEKE